MANSTIAFNWAGNGGGGVYANHYAAVSMANTIVAENTADAGSVDISGAVTANFCVIEDTDGATLSEESSDNITGIAPGQEALTYNGGPTQTIAITSDSIAFNAGSNDLVPEGLTTDQRGEERITNDVVDIGAYEAAEIDLTRPTVTINQADSQSDPAEGMTVTFTAVFSEFVWGLEAADLDISGTATFIDDAPSISIYAENDTSVDHRDRQFRHRRRRDRVHSGRRRVRRGREPESCLDQHRQYGHRGRGNSQPHYRHHRQ